METIIFTYYITATPQSIAVIIKTGCFPTDLPNWLEPKRIICTDSIYSSVKTSNTNCNQIFILKIEAPLQLPAKQKGAKSGSIILEKIDTKWITQIFTYSEKGKKLLQHLLADSQYAPITIAPKIYPVTQTSTALSPANTTASFFPHKRQMTTCPSSTPLPRRKPKIDNGLPVMELRRISTRDEHLELLLSAFKEARRTILITSFAINHDTLRAVNLYSFVEHAKRRGVQIYFYYNDIKQIAKDIHQALLDLGVHCHETYTHSKILAVDHSWVALGSFNWLSGIDTRYPDNLNASIVCQGEVCQDLIEDLWTYLKHYRNIQFGRFRQAENFERYNDCTIYYEITKGEELSYLTTLEQHLDFFQDIFSQAKERIVICSPFISSTEEYREDIDVRLLSATIRRGIEIFFICSPGNPYLQKFKAFLASVNSSKIHLLLITNFHLKTIVVDDQLIAEGSFNWLSAARDQESDFHNHETTLVVQGNIAKNLIANFYSSTIGSIVLEQIYDDTSEVKNETTIPATMQKAFDRY